MIFFYTFIFINTLINKKKIKKLSPVILKQMVFVKYNLMLKSVFDAYDFIKIVSHKLKRSTVCIHKHSHVLLLHDNTEMTVFYE